MQMSSASGFDTVRDGNFPHAELILRALNAGVSAYVADVPQDVPLLLKLTARALKKASEC
jgi:hypothetical protein